MTKVTLVIQKRPQWIATAWLRETGEYRPALDVLRSEDELTPDLREAMANWIENGAKRRRGSKVVSDPWRVYPPKLAASLGLAQTAKEKQAWILFASFPAVHSLALYLPRPNRRGRERTMESAAIAMAAHRLQVDIRTARGWFRKFFPDGY